jgi:hypothetical protein
MICEREVDEMINAQGSDYVLCVYTIPYSPQTRQRFFLEHAFHAGSTPGVGPYLGSSPRGRSPRVSKGSVMRGSSPRGRSPRVSKGSVMRGSSPRVSKGSASEPSLTVGLLPRESWATLPDDCREAVLFF